MAKILAFSGSNSSKSINQKLIRYVANLITDHPVTVIDLREYVLPVYCIDLEESVGIPENAKKLKELFDAHNGFIISLPEHNSSFTAVFKNTLDWLSRVDGMKFNQKPIILMSTSPGPGGGRSALGQGEKVLTGYLSGNVVDRFSLPKFHSNTKIDNGEVVAIPDEGLREELHNAVNKLTRQYLNDQYSSETSTKR